jgi:hypothetical protein
MDFLGAVAQTTRAVVARAPTSASPDNCGGHHCAAAASADQRYSENAPRPAAPDFVALPAGLWKVTILEQPADLVQPIGQGQSARPAGRTARWAHTARQPCP